MEEPLRFEVVAGPPRFESSTHASVRVLDVVDGDRTLGYLWASHDDQAAAFEPRATTGGDAYNASVAWRGALRERKARGLAALAALDDIVAGGGPANAGRIVVESRRDMPSLAELKALARS